MTDMQTAGSLFERHILHLIAERRSQLVENLSNGAAIKSMEDYRAITGRISELDVVVELCAEADKLVNRTL